MKKVSSKILAILLSFAVVLSMMPGMAMAVDPPEGGQTETCEVTINFDISSLGTDEALETLEFEKIPSATVTVHKGDSLADALEKAVEESNKTLNIVGTDNNYITQINHVEGYNLTKDSSFRNMMKSFGMAEVQEIPDIFEYAGWMYSGNGLSGYGISSDTIQQDTVVDFRYTLYYGAASSSEWKSFDWEFIDAYNQLKSAIDDAQKIVAGGYEGFSEQEKDTLDSKLEISQILKEEIDTESSGIWAYYIAEMNTSLWGTGSPTERLKTAYSDLNDAINKVPSPESIKVTGIKNGSESISLIERVTLIEGDTVKLLPVITPEGASQDIVYDVLVGDKAVSLSSDGLITCLNESSLVMIQVKSSQVPSVTTTIQLKILAAPTYTAVFTGIDGVTLTDGSLDVSKGETNYTGVYSDNSVSFSGLKKGVYDYSVTLDNYSESGKLIVNDIDVNISISGKNTETQKNNILEGIAASYVDNSSDWVIMDMAAYAGYNPETAYKTSGAAIQKYINLTVESLSGNTTSDTMLDKAIIALKSIGGDPTKIYRVNDNNPLNAIDILNNTTQSTSAWSAPYTLAAYNQDEFETDANEDTLIDALLKAQGEDGSWNEWGTIDTTANAIAGLSFYKDRKDVSVAIENGINYLSNKQSVSGAFNDGHGDNSNSTAMVVVALASVGINPDTDARFIKNGNSALDGLLSFALNDNSGFGYSDNNTLNPSGTEQSFRALIAASHVMKTGKAYNIYDFSANEVSPVRATGTGTPSVPNPSLGDNIVVKLTIKSDNGYWINNASVTIPGEGATVYHALVKACETYGITTVGAETGYVRSMTKYGRTLSELDYGPNSGWMYKVNGELPNIGLTSCSIKNGDEIVWFYTEDWTTVPGAITGDSDKPSEPSISITDKDGKDASSMGKVEYDASSNCVDISPSSGYKVSDVKVNGVSKGAVTRLEGIKATDRIEVVFEAASAESETPAVSDQTAKIIAGVQAIKPKVTNTRLKSGIKVYWKKNSSYKVSYYQVYRKTGKNGTYKLIYTTKLPTTLKITNVKNLKKGKTYYYRVRGVRVIDGKKYYTKWSNYTYRKFR